MGKFFIFVFILLKSMIKKQVKAFIVFMGVLPYFEKMNFYIKRYQFRNENTQFLKDNPKVILPPDFYMYETFGLSYYKFYTEGVNTAKWVLNHLVKNKDIKNKNILDWGSGAGRIIRHLPKLVDTSNKIYGSDYNYDYVQWCNDNINDITVKHNQLEPPLNFEANFFDFIYSISIFTHLSEKMHLKWMAELNRVAKKGAKVLITVHGNSFKVKLSKKERALFTNGSLVVHSYKIEGNRLFAAYQPELFFKELATANGFKILEHLPGEIKNNKPQQDVWILEKIN